MSTSVGNQPNYSSINRPDFTSKTAKQNFKDQHVQLALRQFADELLVQYDSDMAKLKDLEQKLFQNPDTALFIHAAVKLAISKASFTSITKSLQIGVVVSVFRESRRLRPREIHGLYSGHNSDSKSALDPHPHGENFIIEKDRQIRWILKANPIIKCRLIWVDDGCDADTGKYIEDIISHRQLHDTHEVIYLDKCIKYAKKHPSELISEAIVELKSAKHSKKGGSVYAGMAHSIMAGDDIVVYTDADLSYNLGLLGTLIQPIVDGASASTANRRHELSVSEDAEFLHSPGKKRSKILLGTIRQELLGHFLPTDTQAGFKAFNTANLATVIAMPDKIIDMSFDIQLLARHAASNNEVAVSVPIVVLDSSELSTADNSETYSDMATAVLKVARESQTLTAEAEKILKILSQKWPEIVEILETPSKYKEITDLQRILTTTLNTTASNIKYDQVRPGIIKLISIIS